MTACVITINKIGMRHCSIELNLLNENLKYKANVWKKCKHGQAWKTRTRTPSWARKMAQLVSGLPGKYEDWNSDTQKFWKFFGVVSFIMLISERETGGWSQSSETYQSSQLRNSRVSLINYGGHNLGSLLSSNFVLHADAYTCGEHPCTHMHTQIHTTYIYTLHNAF